MIARMRGAAFAIVALSGCTSVPAVAHPERITHPPIAYLRPPHPGFGFRFTEPWAPASGDRRVARFAFECYDDIQGEYRTVRGELHLPAGNGPFPLVAVGPILGGVQTGYVDCRIFARHAARLGAASYFLYQDEHLLHPSYGATALERMVRSWVHAMIRALDLIRAEVAIDDARLATFGISMGAIRNLSLAAAEPRFGAHVVCLVGGGLGRIIRVSREPMVRRYLRLRSEALGTHPSRIVADLRENFLSDPLAVAPSIDAERVLVFLARGDRTIPLEYGMELHRALGEPRLELSPLGHLSSLIVLPWATRETLAFYRRIWGDIEP